MIRLLNIIIIVLALALVFIIVYPQWQENRPINVFIGCDSTINSHIFIVAQNKEFFQKERIIPQFIFYENPNAMLEDLANDKLTCAICPWPTIIKYALNNQDSIKVIASLEYRSSIPIDAIFINPRSRNVIKQLKDLRNKRLAYPTTLKDIMPTLIKNMGFKATEIKLLEMSNNKLIQALIDNQADAILVIEPERTAALNQGLEPLMNPALPKIVIAPFPGAGVVVKNDFISLKRRAAFKIKMIIDASIAFIDANVDEVRKQFLNFYNLDTTMYGQCYLPQNQKLLEINKGSIISMMTKMFDSGTISNTYDIQLLFPSPSQFRQ